MRIEHVAFQVAQPGEMGDWYVEHLGFTIKRAVESPVPTRFIADRTGKIMLEIYNNPKVQPPDYSKMDPLLFHVAFVCDDLPETVQRLIDAGAIQHAPKETTPAGDNLIFLRDPWGVPIQLCQRAKPMV